LKQRLPLKVPEKKMQCTPFVSQKHKINNHKNYKKDKILINSEKKKNHCACGFGEGP
jgi:hypothetical protein